jgi:hypothetical protein
VQKCFRSKRRKDKKNKPGIGSAPDKQRVPLFCFPGLIRGGAVRGKAMTKELQQNVDKNSVDEIPIEFYLMARRFKSVSEQLEYYIENNRLEGIMPKWEKVSVSFP